MGGLLICFILFTSMVAAGSKNVSIRNLCIERVQNKSFSIWKTLLSSLGTHAVYMGPSTHRNLGDNTLTLSSIRMIQSFNKTIHFCGDTQSNFMPPKIPYCSDSRIVELVKDDGFIFYQPGGNWGDTYPGAHRMRMHTLQLASDHNLSMISGPQSLYYKANSSAESDASRIQSLRSSGRIVLSWRQHDSYEYGVEHYSVGSRQIEVPDMVFSLGGQKGSAPTYDVAVHLRADKESLLKGLTADAVCLQLRSLDLTCAVISWMTFGGQLLRVNGNLSDYVDSAWKQALKITSMGRVSVTDRLHGSVAAYLLGRGVVFLDSMGGKTMGAFRTAFADTEGACFDGDGLLAHAEPSLDKIAESVTRMLRIMRGNDDRQELYASLASEKEVVEPINNKIKKSTKEEGPYYEVAVISPRHPTKLLGRYALDKLLTLEKLMLNNPSSRRFQIWEPVYANGCPHAAHDPKNRVAVPKAYYRGLTLAHMSIWNDFCVYRSGARDNDRILILEDDAVCVVNNCSSVVYKGLRYQNTDVLYWGWCWPPKVYYIPPLCSHAYSITCSAVKVIRDKVDPCGRPIDLQFQSLGSRSLYNWSFIHQSRTSYGVNQSEFIELRSLSVDLSLVFTGGPFMQIKNMTLFDPRHGSIHKSEPEFT